MSKTALIVFLMFLVAGSLFGGSITVIQPNGGEEATLGGKLAIRWSAVNVSQNVRINLVRGSEVVGAIANSLSPSSGYFLWDAGHLAGGGMAPAGNDYLVRIRAIDSTESDQSDEFFSIVKAAMPEPHVPRPRLKMESPNGGESWRLGTEHEIKWTSHFLGGKVMLQLYRHPCCAVGLIADNLPASGSFSWKAGKYLGNFAPQGQYNVRVVSMENYTVSDISDQPFTLKPSLADVVDPGNLELLGKPDLIICAESAVYSPRSTQCTIHVKVRNIGKRTAKAGFEVQLQYAGGEPSRIPVTVDIPPGGTHMPFYQNPARYDVGDTVITYIVDPDNQVAEENEDNNQTQCLWSVREGNLPPNGPLTCSDGSTM